MRKISKLQFITKNATSAELACKGGADWIQLRLKNVSYEDYRTAALEVQAVCRKYGTTFIVNDNVKLALEINADGVHVGKTDPLPQECIDAMLGRGGIIGCTVNAIEDFVHLSGKPVSYLGCGPFRFTNTKQNLSPVLGIDGYKKLFAQAKDMGLVIPPVIGIGGVLESDVNELLSTGLYGVAVSGAVENAADITEAARRFKGLVN